MRHHDNVGLCGVDVEDACFRLLRGDSRRQQQRAERATSRTLHESLRRREYERSSELDRYEPNGAGPGAYPHTLIVMRLSRCARRAQPENDPHRGCGPASQLCRSAWTGSNRATRRAGTSAAAAITTATTSAATMNVGGSVRSTPKSWFSSKRVATTAMPIPIAVPIAASASARP